MDGQINRINLKPPSASSSTRAVAEPRCPSCGDGMKGLRLLKCPECGKSVSATRPATSGPDAGELTQRAELQSALLILLIGAVGSAAFLTYDWGW